MNVISAAEQDCCPLLVRHPASLLGGQQWQSGTHSNMLHQQWHTLTPTHCSTSSITSVGQDRPHEHTLPSASAGTSLAVYLSATDARKQQRDSA